VGDAGTTDGKLTRKTHGLRGQPSPSLPKSPPNQSEKLEGFPCHALVAHFDIRVDALEDIRDGEPHLVAVLEISFDPAEIFDAHSSGAYTDLAARHDDLFR